MPLSALFLAIARTRFQVILQSGDEWTPDRLEDNVLTDRPQTFRTERKMQEVATLVRACRSQSVDDIAAAVRVSHGTCYKILSDDLTMFHVTQHSVSRILSQDQQDDLW
ncbi:hypothetical protein C0J52_07790 [Blattella germanica]|nr:hypothetical protein C0J52_07790 [Blattella germanica]